MKQNVIITTLAATMFAACAGNQAKQEAFATDSVKYENSTKTAEVTIKADFPTAGPTALTTAVKEFFNEELGGNYDGNIDNGDSLLAFYGTQQAAKLNEEAKAFEGSEPRTLLYSETLGILAETDMYITYTANCATYLGGAHGMTTTNGVTFRKSDGRRFGKEMLRDTDNEAFRKLIKEGLMQYFSAKGAKADTDEQLKEMLLTDNGVDYLPLPQFPPCLTKDGVMFTYQPYEIAPYAAGSPTFTVGYDKIKPYLTQTIVKLIKYKRQ